MMYKSILLPVDLEHDGSLSKALPSALMVARATGASLHVLTVVPDVRTLMVSQYFPDDFEEKAASDAAVRLKQFANDHLAGQQAELHIKTGSVYRSIVATADEIGADLIIMASHRPELTDILIGPNAELVARHTKTSVMIVRD